MQLGSSHSQTLLAFFKEIPFSLVLKTITYLPPETIQTIYQQISPFIFYYSPSTMPSKNRCYEQSYNNTDQREQFTVQRQNKNEGLSCMQPSPFNKTTLKHQQSAQRFYILFMFAFTNIFNRQIKSTDRSLHSLLYEQTFFLEYQNQLILNIVKDMEFGEITLKRWMRADEEIEQTFFEMENYMKEFGSEAGFDESEVLDFVDYMKYNFRDPQIPLPKLRKEGVGSYCGSSIQLCLVDAKHPFFSTKKSGNIQPPPQLIAPLISYFLQKDYKNKLQNLDIYAKTKNRLFDSIIKLLISYCKISRLWIEAQTGELQKFITFMNRYSTYTNILIGFQNYVGAILRQEDEQFFSYEEFGGRCSNGLIDVGLQIWESKTKEFRVRNIETYIKILHYYTSKVFIEKVEEDQRINTILQPSQQRWLKNILKLKRVQLSGNRTNLFNKPDLKTKKPEVHSCIELEGPKTHRSISFMSQICLNETEQFFLEDLSLQQQILIEFMEYHIDICVDEFSVNWCGHSQQILRHNYYQLEDEILGYGEKCLLYVQNIAESAQKEMRECNMGGAGSKILNFLFEKYFQVWDCRLLKPVCLRKLLDGATELVQNYFEKYPSEGQEGNNQDEFRQYGLNLSETDNIIKYYNTEVWEIPRIKEK